MSAQALTGQALLVGVQFLLGWLLVPDDYAQAALAFSVVLILGTIQQAGIQQVLVQRQRAWHLWVMPAFLLSLLLGVAFGLIVAGVAPLVASAYHRPELTGLLLVCALLCPVTGACVVPDASLRIALRFKTLAFTLFVTLLVQGSSSVLLAWLGAGAYAIVGAPLAGAAVRCVLLWTLARPRLRGRVRFRRWRYLLSRSVRLLVGQVAMSITYQGGPIVLGALYPESVFPGVFMFSWAISDQAMRILVSNLQQVLFPTLRTLDADRGRQAQAFLRAVRLLYFLGLPACVGLALSAGPLLRLLWRDRWEEAIPIVTALSLGMTSRMIHGPSEAMLQAHGRNTAFMTFSLAYTGVYLVAVSVGALWAQTLGAAIAASVVMFSMSPLALRLALASTGYGWEEVVRVYARASLVVLCAAIPAWFAVRSFESTWRGDLCALALVGASFALIYPAAFRLVAPREWKELMHRVRDFRPAARPAGEA